MTSGKDPNPLFRQEGDLFIPQEPAGSPWSATMLHGGPVNALLTLPVEALANDLGMMVSRLTIDILKPVPMAPLHLTSKIIRKGARMAIVDTAISPEDSDVPVATGRAVLMMEQEGHAKKTINTKEAPLPRSGIKQEPWIPEEAAPHLPPGLHFLIEFYPSTNKDRPVCWIQANAGMLDERPMSALEQCTTGADMATVLAARMHGIQNSQARGDVMGLMNTNTTIHFARPPQGHWYGYTDHFIDVQDGTGIVDCALYDETGFVGRASQNLIVQG